MSKFQDLYNGLKQTFDICLQNIMKFSLKIIHLNCLHDK